jgi:ribulose-phosphate 3-epimerase
MNIGEMDAQRSAQAMQRLREEEAIVLPSLLLCDFGNLEKEVARLEEAGVKALHLDVMDGHFVPNLSYGMPIVAGIRHLTTLPIDVHLMISEPGKYVQQFVDAGADSLTVHAEIAAEVGPVLEQIRAAGVGVGLAINPETSLESIVDELPLCDLLLVMSVNAGFGGQAFNPVALEKLKSLKASSRDLLLEVDGGVNLSTIADCHEAGASLFVVGSAIFGQTDYQQAVRQLMAAIGM